MSRLKVEGIKHYDLPGDSDTIVLSGTDSAVTVKGSITATSFLGDGSSLTGITSYDSAKVQGQFDSAFPAAFDTRFALQDTHDSVAVQAQFDSALPVALASDVSLGNITTTGYLRGPSTFVIDPATHGDDTGTLRVAGNLTVDGTTTTINSTTVTTADKNIVIAQGAADSAAADGAGITIDTVDATLTYVNSGTGEWDFNRRLVINTDTTNETYGPPAGGSYGLTISDAATDSDSICSIKFNSRDAGANYRHFASIAAQKTGQWADNGGSYPGALTFWTRPTSGNQVERMRIDEQGNVMFGYAGVLLDSGAKSIISYKDHYGGNTHVGYIGPGQNNSQASNYYTMGDSGSTVFRTYNGSSYSHKMTIKSDGNVGIGTGSPGVLLSIAGGTGDLLSVGDEGTNSEFIIGNWNSASDADIDGMIPGSTFGTIMRGAPNGHVVMALQENDVSDSFTIVSGGGNYQTDTTFDTVVAYFRADGANAFGTAVPTAGRGLTLDHTDNYYGIEFQTSGTSRGRIMQEATGNMYFDANANLIFRNNTTTTRLTINSSGHLVPGGNGTQDLGTSSARWGTVYTSDLSLKNENGDWTIVEGEDDLFLYNNKKGKVYKFALTEVDPDTAPAKRD